MYGKIYKNIIFNNNDEFLIANPLLLYLKVEIQLTYNDLRNEL